MLPGHEGTVNGAKYMELSVALNLWWGYL